MKRFIIWLMLSVYCISCSTPQSISKTDSALLETRTLEALANSHEKYVVTYVQEISDKLDLAIVKNSPTIDYWDKMILIPVETCLTYDSNWRYYLNQKEEEYIKSLIPECKKDVLLGFEKINVKPKEQDYNLLRAEFILACMGNPERESVRAEVFKRLTAKIDNFFIPIYNKAKSDVQQVYDKLGQAIRGVAASDPISNHNIVQDYFIDERAKLKIRVLLDRKYTPVIESELKKFVNNLSSEQHKMYSLISQSDENYSKKFLQTLSPEQYVIIERVIYKTAFIQDERKGFKERYEKLTTLASWLDENKTRIERDLAQKRQEDSRRGASIAKGILAILGVAVVYALVGYASWRNTYYNNYQTIQTMQANTMPRQIYFYDQKGRFYYGTIY